MLLFIKFNVKFCVCVCVCVCKWFLKLGHTKLEIPKPRQMNKWISVCLNGCGGGGGEGLLSIVKSRV